MTTINQLSSTDSIVGGDLLLVWSTTNSDSRKASVNVLLDYIQDNYVLNSVAGSDKSLQYNNASVLGGASSVGVIAAGTGLSFTGVAQPAAASTGGVNLFASNELGRAILSVRDDNAFEAFLQESYAHRSIHEFKPFNTTSHSSLGMAADDRGTVTGTANSTIGFYWQHASAATLNAEAIVGSLVAGAASNLGFYFCATMLFPDGSYGTGATGTRAAAGLIASNLSNLVSGDTLGATGCGFQYSTSRSDVNWLFRSNNGTSESSQDTGIIFASNKLYQFEIYIPVGGAAVFWRIKNLTDGTRQSGTTTSVPASATMLFMGAGLRTLTTTARNVQFKRLYFQSSI